MSDRSWRGKWWVADDPKAVVPGTLYCAEDGRLRLELVGGFDDEIRIPLPGGNGYAVSMESRGFPLIHGVSGHETFTLIDTLATHTGGTGIFKGQIVTKTSSPTGRCAAFT